MLHAALDRPSTEHAVGANETVSRQAARRLSTVGAMRKTPFRQVWRPFRVGPIDDPAEDNADHIAARIQAGDWVLDGREPRHFPGQAPVAPTHRAAAPPIVQSVLSAGAGRPLDTPTLAFFEPRFGMDLSAIRVHGGDAAERSARAINARAYAAGHDIVLGPGAPPLSTQAGRRLLAHEIAHTVQEDAASTGHLRRTPGEPGVFFNEALGRRDWDVAARLLADMSAGDRQAALRALTTETRLELRRATLALDPSPANVVAADIDRVEAERSPMSDHDLVEAGLLSLGQVMQAVAAPESQALRDLYNTGKAAIEARRTQLLASGATEAQVAEQLATMRFELAMDVRRTGSALMRQGAELIDAVRGQARPTYESLRDLGKTDAEIIESATKTNEFINRLPRNLRYLGKALWFVSAGLSIYVILAAPEGKRAAVAEREIETTVGGIGGAAVGEALCIVVEIATEGLGLIVCGLIGGIAGAEGARRFHLLQFLDITPHDVPALAGTVFRVEGAWDEIDLFIISIEQRVVSPSEDVLVVATGMVSGEQVGGRGHYRSYEVTPASDAAVQLFGSRNSRYVPQYLLVRPSAAELGRVQ